MAEVTDKKKITRIYQVENHHEDAGVRDSSTLKDDFTSFAIPGHNLPSRHCNVDINITVAVASDMTVYLSLHDGKFYQNVQGQGYICRIYACPHYFEMHIPKGAAGIEGWKKVEFTSDGKDITNDDQVFLVGEGEVHKSQPNTVPFEWVFGPCVELVEKEEYYENDIIKNMPYHLDQHGGSTDSDSRFVNMGLLTSWNWKKEMGSSQDGKIWICGGILYPTAGVTSDITAKAFEVTIPGLNLASYYYPGDIQKDERMSLNRPEGYLRIYKLSSDVEYLDEEGGWRDIKNTENDRAVEEGFFENWGFRLHEDGKWHRLIITGAGGRPEDGEDGEGIGSDNPGGSGSNSGSGGSGGCCCS